MGSVLLFIIIWYFVIAFACGVWYRFARMQEGDNDFVIYRYGLSWPFRAARKFSRN